MKLELRRLNTDDEAAFRESLNLFSDMQSEWYSFVWKKDVLVTCDDENVVSARTIEKRGSA